MRFFSQTKSSQIRHWLLFNFETTFYFNRLSNTSVIIKFIKHVTGIDSINTIILNSITHAIHSNQCVIILHTDAIQNGHNNNGSAIIDGLLSKIFLILCSINHSLLAKNKPQQTILVNKHNNIISIILFFT